MAGTSRSPAGTNLLVGAYADDYAYLASGSTPASVVEKYKSTIPAENAITIQQFNAMCLVAAAANKRAVVEVLERPDRAEALRFINRMWSLRGEPNNTAMNMVGHLLLVAGNLEGSRMAEAYRRRIGGTSIWDVDITKSHLSDQQRRIIVEKLMMYSRDEAYAAGVEICNTAVKRLRELMLPAIEASPHRDPASGKRARVSGKTIDPMDAQFTAPPLTPATRHLGLDDLNDDFKALYEELIENEAELKSLKGEDRQLKILECANKRRVFVTSLANEFGQDVVFSFPTDLR